MLLHQLSFILATAFSLIVFTLDTVKVHAPGLDEDTKLRMEIANNWIDTVHYFPWFFVNILILQILSKHGKPLGADDEVFIQTKLIEWYNKLQEQEESEL